MILSPFIATVLLFPFTLAAQRQIAKYHHLPPLREQAAIQDAWTAERISNIPNILKKYNADAWLMTQKEYAEDTVFWSLKSATQFFARRRTVDLFIANASPGTKSSYNWIDNTNEVWTELLDILESQNISRIAINADEGSAFSSGLHVGELEMLKEKLGKGWVEKFVVERMVAVEFVATMVEGRLGWYRKLQETAWAMITEGFSSSVIEPGKTTTADVEWWLREKILHMNYTTWFQPTVSVLGEKSPLEIASTGPPGIEFGDLLHVDFGVTALGMNTDTQHLAYVLGPGETEEDILTGYLDGLKKVNRLQDILKSNMVVGVSGN
ncbi:hypothetical protein HYALB_00002600 [Hymenoscyphus albidus]|uniref:Peptidase M24 domain-containing protein n=1 Tax=Hymenoscyphus albidus TaxID=595503 RepID=A0A9N9PYU6_9HELO|nr:hypothetical protein HYALB_00002600 [Hymenoscyphus albidus]